LDLPHPKNSKASVTLLNTLLSPSPTGVNSIRRAVVDRVVVGGVGASAATGPTSVASAARLRFEAGGEGRFCSLAGVALLEEGDHE